MNLPPVPIELKKTLITYLEDLHSHLEVFLAKFQPDVIQITDEEAQDFQVRFHRIKGSSGFFKFSDTAELASEGERLFKTGEYKTSGGDIKFRNIVLNLENHYEIIHRHSA